MFRERDTEKEKGRRRIKTLTQFFCPTVSLDSLSTQQLTAVKKQLDDEVEHLTTSFAQLQAAQIKFKDCLRCVKTQGTTKGMEGKNKLTLNTQPWR